MGGAPHGKFASYKSVNVEILPFLYTVNQGKENYYVRNL